MFRDNGRGEEDIASIIAGCELMQSIVFWPSLATALLLRSEVTVYYYCKLPRSNTYVIHTCAWQAFVESRYHRYIEWWSISKHLDTWQWRGTNDQSGIDVSVAELLSLCLHAYYIATFIRFFVFLLQPFTFIYFSPQLFSLVIKSK